MTHHDDLDRELVTWFSDDAARRMRAGLLGSIEAASLGRRQQPGWLVTLRGDSMGSAVVVSTRTRRLALVAVLAALAALLAIVLAGQQRPKPIGNGPLAFVRNGDVYLANPDGRDARLVLHQDGFAFSTVAWSPNGASLAVDGGSGVVVLEISTGNARFVGGSNPVWSPHGRELAVLDTMPGSGEGALRLVDPASLATRATYLFAANSGLAWSPNGRWIAATGGDASNSIVRIDVHTGDVIQIEGPSGHLDAAREVSWSPDSLRVAFVRYGSSNGPTCADHLSCRVNVVMADADGDNAVLVNAAPGRADLPAWSPDGQWLAYRATDAGPGLNAHLDGRGIQIIRADGTGERSLVITPVGEFVWSRDSASLLYTVRGETSAVTIWETSLSGEARSLGISIDGGFRFERTGLGFEFSIAAASASVLPIGALVTPASTLDVATPVPAAPADLAEAWPTLLGQSEDGCAVVKVATVDGRTTNVADLCKPQANESSTGVPSPRGDAYALIRDGRLTILPTNGLAGLDVAEPAGLSSVAWSPGASWLAVSGVAVKGHRFYLLRPDGSGLHEIPGNPSWSPDGRTMVIATAEGSLLIGRSDGTGLASIGELPAPVTWSPDGARFAFVRGGDLWTAAIDGSDVRNVTSFRFGGASGAAWSPDGAWIAVTGGRGLWLMAPDGSKRRWLDPGPGQFFSGVSWSPDSNRLAVQAIAESDDGSQTPLIYLVSAEGSPAIRIDASTDPSWSPDGRFLVATAVDVLENGWIGGSLAVMHADGSGRHELGTAWTWGPLVWMRP
jgi:Tol biopolymer transport system component